MSDEEIAAFKGQQIPQSNPISPVASNSRENFFVNEQQNNSRVSRSGKKGLNKSQALSNKAMAFLNSKKANSILKSYEESMGAKFLNNTPVGRGSGFIKRNDEGGPKGYDNLMGNKSRPLRNPSQSHNMTQQHFYPSGIQSQQFSPLAQSPQSSKGFHK